MKNLVKFTCLGLAMVLAFNTGSAWAQKKAPKRSITKIAGDLYRFENNFHASVFYVTDEGVLVTDPINTGTAKWLKAEIKKRFNKRIKYLVYSHDHQDHNSGDEVFADATIIGHYKIRAAMPDEKRPTPAPTLTFSDQMAINLGGEQIELTYVGLGYSDNSIVMRFPTDWALFAVEFISEKRLAFKTMSDTYVPGLVQAIRTVRNMDSIPFYSATVRRVRARMKKVTVIILYNAVLVGSRDTRVSRFL